MKLGRAPLKNIRRRPSINLNLILSKESTATKDVGTTVDKTTIPVECWAIKSTGKTSPPCFCSPQWYLKMPGNKPESCFVQRVNSCKGCWYHNQQDHNPSLTLSNQIKWQGITLPPWVCSLQWYSKMPCNKPESSFVQRVNSRKGCWYHSRQDHKYSLMLSNQNKWQDLTLPPCVCSAQWYSKMPCNKPESCFVQRVNSCKRCWYQSWQGHNPSLMLSYQIKWQDVTIPLCVCSVQQ